MPLKDTDAIELAKRVKGYQDGERTILDNVRQYWKGRQALPAVIPTASPNEVKVMARSSRVNVLPIVVNSLVQSTFVDGFRADKEDENADVWRIWQANRMDARQTGIHRATAAYGAAYAVVLPGDTAPVIRGVSPRRLTALYGEDPDWPIAALERVGYDGLWRLYDEEAIYYLSSSEEEGEFEFVSFTEHGSPYTPVIRYLDEDDLDVDDEVEAGAPWGREAMDAPTTGQIGPLMPLQDQIDLTTFGLQVAQHYGAFKQRYIIGWVADTEADKLKVGMSRILTFDESPEDMKIGEFDQTNLDGYIKSRETSLKHAATLSQTAVHELTGDVIQMSAEALAAAEAGKDRKVGERKKLWGESHEQTLWTAGQIGGVQVPDDAQVVWADTSARSFAATVDALGKLSTLLSIPPQELWERVPGATQQDVKRWKAAAEQGDAFGDLTRALERQASGANA